MHQPFEPTPQGPRLCWALQQTAGRGRLGRAWHSDPTQAISFSIAFETNINSSKPLSILSPAAGLALAESLNALAQGVKVKWPNDLWREQRKISGLLLEASTRGNVQRVVLGLGVNLYWGQAQRTLLESASQASGLPAQAAGGLFDSPATPAQRLKVLTLAARTFAELWRDYLAKDAPLEERLSRWTAHDALADSEIHLYSGATLLAQGLNAGVDHSGALLLKSRTSEPQPLATNETPTALLQRFEIGEISIRPKPTQTLAK